MEADWDVVPGNRKISGCWFDTWFVFCSSVTEEMESIFSVGMFINILLNT